MTITYYRCVPAICKCILGIFSSGNAIPPARWRVFGSGLTGLAECYGASWPAEIEFLPGQLSGHRGDWLHRPSFPQTEPRRI